MLTRTQVFSLTIAALLVLTLTPGASFGYASLGYARDRQDRSTAAAPAEPSSTLNANSSFYAEWIDESGDYATGSSFAGWTIADWKNAGTGGYDWTVEGSGSDGGNGSSQLWLWSPPNEARVTFSTESSAVSFMMTGDWNDGYAKFYVDDILIGNYDLYNMGKKSLVVSNLDLSVHTIKVVQTGEQNPKSKDCHVAIFGGAALQLTFSISGHIHDSDGNPIPNVTVSASSGVSATTDASGVYTITGLLTDTYTITPTAESSAKNDWTFEPPTRTVSVPPSATGVDFTGMSKPPLLMVHGIMVFDFENWGHRCKGQPERFDGSNSTMGDLPEWLAKDYDVWVAYLDSSLLHTPALERNAECLRKQIDYLYDQTNGQKITLVAHSMGGLVSRGCLSFEDCHDKVDALYTLGSPHAGLNAGIVAKLLLKLAEKYLASHGIPIPVGDGVCAWQPALCQMSAESMLFFNNSNYNQRDISYTFIGGEATPPWPGWLFWPTEGPNDGVVGRNSAVGRAWFFGWRFLPPGWASASPPTQYWTDEVHIPSFGDAYYEERKGNPSQSYGCIAYQEGLSDSKPDYCRDAATTLSVAESASPNLSQATASLEGIIHNGESITHTVEVDTDDAALFSLAWTSGTLQLTLTQPGGQVITPEYAAAHPSLVAYDSLTGSHEFPLFATYAFTNTLPGAWQMTLQAVNVDSGGAGYVGFVALETNRVLSVTQDANLYNVGDTATFTATLQRDGSGISGAEVTATLRRPDGVTNILTLADVGDGVYRASYVVPDAGGHVVMEVVTAGNDGDAPFTRQTERLWMIAPDVAHFTGNVSDRAVDRNGDGTHDTLLVDVQVDVTQPSTYTLSAQLTKASTDIASSAVYTSITTAGIYTFQLAFDGSDIWAARLDGPYTITNAILKDVGSGGVPVDSVDVLHTTAAYNWRDFGSELRVYLPLALRNYEPLRADFIATPTTGTVPLTVTFTNESTGPYTSSLWRFGDGFTSTLQNPVYTYNTLGDYTVTLTISGTGGTDTLTRTHYITILYTGCPGNVVVNGDFEQDSAGWYTFTTGEGPKAHDLIGSDAEGFYPFYGHYAARLGGYEGVQDIITQTVVIPPGGQFSYWWRMHTYETLPHHDTLSVELLESDGTRVALLSHRDDQDAQNIWQRDSADVSEYAGESLTLRISSYNDNYYFTTFDVDEICIITTAPLQAGFVATPTTGTVPLTVTFTNTSTGAYTSSLWDFGDGSTVSEAALTTSGFTSTLENPTHTYTDTGAYTVTLAISGPGGTSVVSRTNYISVQASFAAQVVDLVNAQRAQEGCPALIVDPRLVEAAEGHSEDMALNDFVSHTGSDGSSPADRIEAAGYQWSVWAENIASGYSTPEDVVAGWMESTGHRENILNCDLEGTGVGYYYLSDDPGDEVWHHYWTQVFASPQSKLRTEPVSYSASRRGGLVQAYH